MRFGLCYIVVLNNGTHSKGVFAAIYKMVDFNFGILAKCNHKGLSEEHVHHFLNKSTPIAMEDRQSNDIFVPTRIVAGCAWNSVPIDGTDTLHSNVAIGCE